MGGSQGADRLERLPRRLERRLCPGGAWVVWRVIWTPAVHHDHQATAHARTHAHTHTHTHTHTHGEGARMPIMSVGRQPQSTCETQGARHDDDDDGRDSTAYNV